MYWERRKRASAKNFLGQSYRPRQCRRGAFAERMKDDPAQQRLDRDLLVASAALGMATTSLLFPSATILATVSLPLSLFVFVPTFATAYRSLRQERRITNPVLVTTRLGVCVVMNFYGIAALDAFLFSVAQRWNGRSRQAWSQTLDTLFAEQPEWETRHFLEQAVGQTTSMEQQAQASANRMAPFMLTAFVVTLPFYGANRAASFLMTGFGAHLQTLGPTTLHEVLRQAAEQGIVVKNGRLLETATLSNVLLLDAKLLLPQADKQSLLYALRQQLAAAQEVDTHAIKIMAVGVPQPWLTEAGVDEVIPPTEKTAVLAQLQAAGQRVCYVGDGLTEADIMAQAHLSVSLNGLATAAEDAAQVILLDGDLATLQQFFAGATHFQQQQALNLSTPIWFDFVDISTTVIAHLGLLYSTLFNYSGLLWRTWGAKRPFFPNSQTPEAAEPFSADHTRQLIESQSAS